MLANTMVMSAAREITGRIATTLIAYRGADPVVSVTPSLAEQAAPNSMQPAMAARNRAGASAER